MPHTKKHAKKKLSNLGLIGIVLTVFSLIGYLLYNSLISRQATIAEVGTQTRPNSIAPGGKTFAFINNPRQDLTDEQAKYLANNYDLVVIGYQSDPMIISANKIRSYNPDVKLLLYFPTSVRQTTAKYGVNEFKESWYLHDLSANQRIIKGGAESLERVDLTQADYIDWAKQKVTSFMQQAPFSGVVFDNANPIGLTTDRNEWISTIGQTKLDSWNKSLINYLSLMTSTLNQDNKVLIYNGIHRTDVKVNRSLDLMKVTNGALNERFCYEKNSVSAGLLSKEEQIEDINLQLSTAKNGKYVLQKVNWEGMYNSLSKEARDRYGNYCYGIFLMGHVPGFTFFKFGAGYNLARESEEYLTQAPAVNIDIGLPLGIYSNNNGLLTRQFENAYVVVNLNKSPMSWENPRTMESITIPPEQSRIVKNDQSNISNTPTPDPNSRIACRIYCREQQNYSNGWCAKKAANCALNSGVHYPQADNLCTTGLSCCCRN